LYLTDVSNLLSHTPYAIGYTLTSVVSQGWGQPQQSSPNMCFVLMGHRVTAREKVLVIFHFNYNFIEQEQPATCLCNLGRLGTSLPSHILADVMVLSTQSSLQGTAAGMPEAALATGSSATSFVRAVDLNTTTTVAAITAQLPSSFTASLAGVNTINMAGTGVSAGRCSMRTAVTQ
jgi:hypothetical protein